MTIKRALLLSFSAILIGACNSDIDEFRFSGKVINASMCAATEISYAIALSEPDSIGDTLTVGGVLYPHVMLAHQSPRRLYDGEMVEGVAYLRKDYSAFNCWGIIFPHLPETVLISVDEAEEN